MTEFRPIDRNAMVLALNALKNIAEELAGADQARKVPDLRRLGGAMLNNLATLGWDDAPPFVPDEAPVLDLPYGQQP